MRLITAIIMIKSLWQALFSWLRERINIVRSLIQIREAAYFSDSSRIDRIAADFGGIAPEILGEI